MKVLHVVKTSDGGGWAAREAAELARLGVEVHVALPSATEGRALPYWRESGATMHVVGLDFPARAPWRLARVCQAARSLIASVSPDLIHSHFVGTTLLLRHALGRDHSVPRVFQVAGPLHLEHWPYRTWDLATAGPQDFWIGSSRCIVGHYLRSGARPEAVFLSYYGADTSRHPCERSGALRRRLGIRDEELVVGNISFIYPPKLYLGQTVGLKCHEDLIDALAMVTRQRRDVIGVLAGGTFGKSRAYEQRLRKRACEVAGTRIHMPGYLSPDEVLRIWPDFDCAIHVPLSENCGGVGEPLLASVPTIAGNVGGLPEVVMDGLTGKTVPVRNPKELAAAILEVLDNRDWFKALAKNGQQLVRAMFDVRRTAFEVYTIYRHILFGQARPAEFDSGEYAQSIARHNAPPLVPTPETVS